ncbi:MAG TPA: CoA ester lyase [Candidatus Methylomirabilis sp.]|nr:CoA ester lyase [Candidatus Methylomirabilis sp.]
MALSRSLLFVPAHVEKMLDKALGLSLDATILDLEDAVPPGQKAAARDGARAYVERRPGHAFVRINPLTSRAPFTTACGAEDLAAVVMPGLRGVVFPKVEMVEDLEAVDAAMAVAERRARLIEGGVELYSIIETASGVLDARAIARARMRRPHRLCFGAGDFTRDIGVEWSREERESFTARSMIVLASRAAGLPAPIDSVFVDFNDPEGLRASTRVAKQLGFRGKLVIHPSQVAIVNDVFTPTAEEVAWARRVVDGLATAEREGLGAFVVDGRMVDYPIVERARDILGVWRDIETATR